MGLDIWFREDLERAIKAAELRGESRSTAIKKYLANHPQARAELQAYQEGHRDALRVLGQAFGVRL